VCTQLAYFFTFWWLGSLGGERNGGDEWVLIQVEHSSYGECFIRVVHYFDTTESWCELGPLEN
jgi:hypothetical protein